MLVKHCAGSRVHAGGVYAWQAVFSRVCVCCVSIPIGDHVLSLAAGWNQGTESHSSLASARLPNPASSNMGYMNLQTDLMCNTGKKKGIFLLQVNLIRSRGGCVLEQ